MAPKGAPGATHGCLTTHIGPFDLAHQALHNVETCSPFEYCCAEGDAEPAERSGGGCGDHPQPSGAGDRLIGGRSRRIQVSFCVCARACVVGGEGAGWAVRLQGRPCGRPEHLAGWPAGGGWHRPPLPVNNTHLLPCSAGREMYGLARNHAPFHTHPPPQRTLEPNFVALSTNPLSAHLAGPQIHGLVLDVTSGLQEVGANQRHANQGIFILCKAVSELMQVGGAVAFAAQASICCRGQQAQRSACKHGWLPAASPPALNAPTPPPPPRRATTSPPSVSLLSTRSIPSGPPISCRCVVGAGRGECVSVWGVRMCVRRVRGLGDPATCHSLWACAGYHGSAFHRLASLPPAVRLYAAPAPATRTVQRRQHSPPVEPQFPSAHPVALILLVYNM